MVVTIRNWNVFNPRTDVKRPSWFRLENTLFEDHEFYSFSSAELVAWIYLLSIASKKNSPNVRINLSHAEKVGRLKERDVLSAIAKLEQLQIITVDVTDELRGRNVDVTDAFATRRDETERDGTNEHLPDSARAEPRRVLDFESLYRKYPRKEGKAKGVAICKAQVKSPEDFAALSQAIDSYAAHCKRSATEAKYIKHFSTFMGSWRDWLEPDAGQSAKSPAGIDWNRVFAEEKKNAV